jgi:hypothetical protein
VKYQIGLLHSYKNKVGVGDMGNINCNNHKIKIKSFKDLESRIATWEEKKRNSKKNKQYRKIFYLPS